MPSQSSTQMMQLRLRNLRAGAMLSLDLADYGPGTGTFILSSPGARQGFLLAPVVGDSLAFNSIMLNKDRLSVSAASDVDILDLRLYAKVGRYGLRGAADVPASASMQITTAYDRTTIIGQSSWWVLFESDQAASSETSRPDPQPPDPKPATSSQAKGEKK